MNRRPPENQMFQTTDRLTIEGLAELAGVTVDDIHNMRANGLGPPQHRTHSGEKFYRKSEAKLWIADTKRQEEEI